MGGSASILDVKRGSPLAVANAEVAGMGKSEIDQVDELFSNSPHFIEFSALIKTQKVPEWETEPIENIALDSPKKENDDSESDNDYDISDDSDINYFNELDEQSFFEVCTSESFSQDCSEEEVCEDVFEEKVNRRRRRTTNHQSTFAKSLSFCALSLPFELSVSSELSLSPEELLGHD
eukprot:CAMPEP_0117018140 /NCGR_PEP_ID=MMETSP0472-20121206/14055_1 /TAXON_ID=693140 ORGANISM="Tiarina fusus, Strain LIS" /NCGR_SAMPLE_ID=MMETSP0472 /ASSEMBLY_ACC=CAM_ASM_000603 /LENGTH=177 /DNA_ID=CAMNT_0004722681 /DNA_START=147 /DNA_END=677 /DNA_ORIENTATION=+